MVHTIASQVPNLLPDWHFIRPAGRLIWATLVLVVSVAVILRVCKRPKPVEPATWAQCMLGAVATFGLMLLAYGTIPHEWLQFGNSYLHLGDSQFVVRAGQQICVPGGSVCTPLHWVNFSINKRALNDVGATLIYIVLLSLNILLFAKWQKRPVAKPVEAVAADGKSDLGTEAVQDLGTSAYGRPMTAKV